MARKIGAGLIVGENAGRGGRDNRGPAFGRRLAVVVSNRRVVLEMEYAADTCRLRGCVAVAIGHGCGQGHEVRSCQRYGIVRICCVGMFESAHLIERDHTCSIDTDLEHQVVAANCAAFNNAAIER